MYFKIYKTLIFISPLFSILISIILLVDTTGIMLFGFLSAFLHELGHVVCMLFVGKTVEKIVLSPCGILIETSGVSNYFSDLLIALSGPAVNLILGVVSLIALSTVHTTSLLYFCASNFGLFLFNSLPVFGLDGMDVLRSFLQRRYSYSKTTIICKIISTSFLCVCAVSSVIFTLFDKINPTIYICLLYLLIISLINAKK